MYAKVKQIVQLTWSTPHTTSDRGLMATLFYIYIYICPASSWVTLKQIQRKAKEQQMFLKENHFLTKTFGHLEFVECACIISLRNKTQKKSQLKASRRKNIQIWEEVENKKNNRTRSVTLKVGSL